MTAASHKSLIPFFLVTLVILYTTRRPCGAPSTNAVRYGGIVSSNGFKASHFRQNEENKSLPRIEPVDLRALQDETNNTLGKFQQHLGVPDHAPSRGFRRICLIACVSSKGFKNMSYRQTALHLHLIKSLRKTIESKYEYSLMIGIDQGDTYWHRYRTEMLGAFKDKRNIDMETIYVKGGSFTKALNAVAAYAFNRPKKQECDYFVRINDDSEFASNGWTTMAVKKLKSYRPQNVGVVGPTVKEGNTNILVFDFVHRTHIYLFGTYYPTQLNNWWIDDWITNVYKPHNYAKLSKWKMKHVMKHGRRYSVNWKEKKSLADLVKKGKSIVQSNKNRT
jgi:hypothetical protein